MLLRKVSTLEMVKNKKKKLKSLQKAVAHVDS